MEEEIIYRYSFNPRTYLLQQTSLYACRNKKSFIGFHSVCVRCACCRYVFYLLFDISKLFAFFIFLFSRWTKRRTIYHIIINAWCFMRVNNGSTCSLWFKCFQFLFTHVNNQFLFYNTVKHHTRRPISILAPCF